MKEEPIRVKGGTVTPEKMDVSYDLLLGMLQDGVNEQDDKKILTATMNILLLGCFSGTEEEGLAMVDALTSAMVAAVRFEFQKRREELN